MAIGLKLGSNSLKLSQAPVNGVSTGKEVKIEDNLSQRFSSGDRVILTYRENENRDGGVEAFGQENYDKAADYFDQDLDA